MVHGRQSGQTPVVLAFDHQLLDVAHKFLTGCSQHLRSAARIVLLTRGLSPAELKSLERIRSEAPIQAISLHEPAFRMHARNLGHTSPSTYDRLLAPLLIPESAALYLDLDIWIRRTILPLISMPLGNAPVAARPSKNVAWRSIPRIVEAAAKLEGRDGMRVRASIYLNHSLRRSGFNAGVVLMNLARMRSDDFTSMARMYAAKYALNDQDILNIYSNTEYVEIGAEWNWWPTQDMWSDPAIVHWIGPRKPWNSRCAYRDIWDSKDVTSERN